MNRKPQTRAVHWNCTRRTKNIHEKVRRQKNIAFYALLWTKRNNCLITWSTVTWTNLETGLKLSCILYIKSTRDLWTCVKAATTVSTYVHHFKKKLTKCSNDLNRRNNYSLDKHTAKCLLCVFKVITRGCNACWTDFCQLLTKSHTRKASLCDARGHL